MVLATLLEVFDGAVNFVCGVRQGPIQFLHVDVQFFHIVLFLLYIVDTLLENQLTHMYAGFISRFYTPLFYMFFCQYYNVLIILALHDFLSLLDLLYCVLYIYIYMYVIHQSMIQLYV